MSNETTQEGTKKSRKVPPPIGTMIPQFTTFGGNETVESPEVQNARPSTVEHGRMSEVKQFESPDKENVRMPGVQTLEQPKGKQSERRQKTVYLSPALAHWLKVQAAQEEREISEIVEDALKLYRDRMS